jgi:hypothetical protein
VPHRGPGKHVATSHFLQYLCLDVCWRSPGRDTHGDPRSRVWPRPEAADLTDPLARCDISFLALLTFAHAAGWIRVFYNGARLVVGRLAPCRRAAASRLLSPQVHLISLVESNAPTETSPTGCQEFGIPRHAAACAETPLSFDHQPNLFFLFGDSRRAMVVANRRSLTSIWTVHIPSNGRRNMPL